MVVFPLTDLLSSVKKFVWSPQCESAFLAAKDIICNAPVLSAPNFSSPFKLQVDASAVGAGEVLLQEGCARVCYLSKKFSKCQRNYSTIEKEALALVLLSNILQFMWVVVVCLLLSILTTTL